MRDAGRGVLLSLVLAASSRGGEKIDPIPRASPEKHFTHPYILDNIAGEQVLPPRRDGGIRFQMRLWDHQLVQMGPHAEYNREFELIRLLAHEEPSIRLAALEELARSYRNVRVARAFTRRLADDDRRVRERAAYALGKQGFRGAILPLIDMLPRTHGSVRASIAMALADLTGEPLGDDYDRWRDWYEGVHGDLYHPSFKFPANATANPKNRSPPGSRGKPEAGGQAGGRASSTSSR